MVELAKGFSTRINEIVSQGGTLLTPQLRDSLVAAGTLSTYHTTNTSRNLELMELFRGLSRVYGVIRNTRDSLQKKEICKYVFVTLECCRVFNLAATNDSYRLLTGYFDLLEHRDEVADIDDEGNEEYAGELSE